MKVSAQDLDNTTFASGGYHSRIAGLKQVEASGEGYWDSTPDPSLFSGIGVSGKVHTISSQGAETNIAYLWLANRLEYMQFGAIGTVTPFSITSRSSDPQGLIRGQVASAKRTINATGQVGSILTIAGPAGATNFVYATLHVFTAGTTVTIQLQSATTLGFAGPTTRQTIGPITTAGGTWAVRVAGPITDGFWRLNCSAITGSFSVAGAIGVQ